MKVDGRERLRVVLGACIGLLITAGLSEWLMPHGGGVPWLVAPLGASAVLVFGVPASPLAQPWAVVAGNAASALVGIACVHVLGAWPEVAAAVAVALAIGLMFLLRCLHPPGGAAALLMVLAGVKDWSFAAEPVLLNSCLMVAAGMVYNTLTGRRYPHPQGAMPPAAPVATPAPDPAGSLFSEADLDAVLARYNQVLDVPRDDLRDILNEAGLMASRRRITTLRCADVMSGDPKAVEWGTPLQDAWALLREHRIKALPVIDRARRVVGIVTLHDFMREASLDLHEDWPTRLRRLLTPSPLTHSTKPEVVGQIMTRQVRVVSADRPLAELVPLFAATGHHHIPVVGPEARLVGILTQSDLVAALARMDAL
ncbi:HPP family protein [Roseateles depolymerans]|uniref:CBS domain containing membrane protein n=1 Tax=Roseateles depolymerans TaxID=76731 RepID=A0A0U2TWP8_9BURK|nr:HPP family protein [Roseateles depolymerans]ALV04641.1 CBS domain containing membrane protein [Roseateles depolymerans]REG09340.1 CBS domain-containing membrane protein [Roseateles depolymerans]